MSDHGGEVESLADGTLDRIADGVAALDSAFRYTYVNSRAELLLDRESSELLGRCVWDVFPDVAESEARDRLEEAMATQERVSFERYNAGLNRWFETAVYPDEDGITLVFRDVTDQKATERELTQILETTPVGIVVLTTAGEIRRANTRAAELLGLTRTEIESRRFDNSEWDIWDADGTAIPRAEHPVTVTLETGEAVLGYTHGITLPDGTERWLLSNTAAVTSADGAVDCVVVAVEDVTELKRLDRLIEIIHPVNDVLNHAGSRGQVAQDVCDLMASSGMYELAWIANYTPGTTHLEPAARAGPRTEYVDDIEIPLTDSGPGRPPVLDVIETRSLQVVTDIESDETFEPWREAALDHGLRAVAGVPIINEETVDGVLALYTAREDAFDEREQGLLETLGERIGQVSHALETETLLHADNVVELTFRSTDSNSFLIETSDELDCTIDVHTTIPTADSSVLCYITVTNVSPAAVRDRADSERAIAGTRILHRQEQEPGGALELEIERNSLAQTLVTANAVVTTDCVSQGTAEIVCELSPDRDIGGLVNRVTDQFPETELVAKHERERSAETMTVAAVQTLADVFATELTDRQRQVLRAAFHAGYFSSPRQSTATEIADALAMTQPTFAYHLRKAEQTLFGHLFASL